MNINYIFYIAIIVLLLLNILMQLMLLNSNKKHAFIVQGFEKQLDKSQRQYQVKIDLIDETINQFISELDARKYEK